MEATVIEREDAEKERPDELFDKLESSPKGLSSDEARQRLQQYGPNALEEEEQSALLKFLGYFWGPIPWMIEVAAVLSLVVQRWTDFIIIMVMLAFNAVVGFWEEHQAANALDALKQQLALKARALRDGKWQEVSAKDLVPGDVIRVRLGDIIPADIKLVDGEYLSVDQSALTGESLPVDKKAGDVAYSGSTAKQGEMTALVTATGGNTYFGRTAKLVESAGAVSHFQKAVMHIGDFLIVLAVVLSVVLVIVEIIRGESILVLIQFVLILVVASIPVAMPAVLSVTMALGALALSKMKAIVSRLQSIEEMAGIDVLCSDKTGTLTQNRLKLNDPVRFEAEGDDDLILAAALASEADSDDAIDQAVLSGLDDRAKLQPYEQVEFEPFDPSSKRTVATLKDRRGNTFKTAKGAPQVIIKLCELEGDEKDKAEKTVDDLAAKGFRTLGVARAAAGAGPWKFLGILSLEDPPREDSADTITQARKHGIRVKMVTGDNTSIAKEISRELGLGTNIQRAGEFFHDGQQQGHLDREAEAKIERADGFAEVFPEHKYDIVKALQQRGHLVAMTGDGVNDAPALKQADVGVAVSGATNAARSAASLVLTESGLSVIIAAVDEARRIFERMNSYTIYRIAMTIDIMFFVVVAMLSFSFYPLTAVMIIILALLDDVPIMTIAYDNTYLNPKPVRWDMKRVVFVSSVLGGLALVESFVLILIGRDGLHLPQDQLRTMLFLQLVAGGHLMLFLTRTKKFFWQPPFPAWPLAAAILATQVFAVFLAAYGWGLVPAISWGTIGIVWAYDIAWMIVQDFFKVGAHRLIEDRARHKQRFLKSVNQSLHSHDVS